MEALGGKLSTPAWKSKPSCYLLVTDDRMIPIGAQKTMAKRAGSTTSEVHGSHSIYISNPKAVAALIEKASHAVKAADTK